MTWTSGPLYIDKNDIVFKQNELRRTLPSNYLDSLFDDLNKNINDYNLCEVIKPFQKRKAHLSFRTLWENGTAISPDDIFELISHIKKAYDKVSSKDFWEESYDVGVMSNGEIIQLIFHAIECETVFDMESLWDDISNGFTSFHANRLWNLRISYEIDISVEWYLYKQGNMNSWKSVNSFEDSLVGVYS